MWLEGGDDDGGFDAAADAVDDDDDLDLDDMPEWRLVAALVGTRIVSAGWLCGGGRDASHWSNTIIASSIRPAATAAWVLIWFGWVVGLVIKMLRFVRWRKTRKTR